jgi:hypothetical protein
MFGTKPDSIILLPETQLHVVIFPAKPANLAELIIVAAELEQGIAAKHRHRIDQGSGIRLRPTVSRCAAEKPG